MCKNCEMTHRMDFILRILQHIFRGFVRLLRPCLEVCWVRRPFGTGRPQRIAVLVDSGVGDTLMASSLLRELRLQLPNAIILAVVDRGTAQVLTGNPDIDGICLFRNSGMSPKLNWRSLSALRNFHPQVMIVPQTGNTLMQTFAAYYAGAPVRIKHEFRYPTDRRYSDYEFLFTHSPPVSENRHRVWDNLALLEPLGLNAKPVDVSFLFPIGDWETDNARSRLVAKGWNAAIPIACMHPGVGTATLKKQWPAGKFAELGRRLAAGHGVQIVLVGGRAEVELCRQVAGRIGEPCFVVAGECSLAETAAVIKLSRLFVSNDSGLMHLAAAVQARGVAIYGKTNPVKIGPFGGDFRIVQGDDIDSIPVEYVYSKCVELLREIPREKSA